MIANIVRFRQTMLATGKKTELHVRCAVTRDTIGEIGGLARLALALQIDGVLIGEARDTPVVLRQRTR